MAAKTQGVADQLALCLPMIVTLITLLVLASPSFAGLRYLPQVWMVSLFFWRVYSPSAAPYWAGFMIGLVYDVVSGAPLGVHALAVIASMMLLERVARRLVRLSFRMLWLASGAFIAVLLALSALTAVLAGSAVTMSWLGAAWIATAASYPLWHALFAVVLKLMPVGSLRD